jgi:leucine-zipper of insertion element IS481
MADPNARLTPHGRRLLADRVRAGWTITAAARAAGISHEAADTLDAVRLAGRRRGR